MLRMIPRNAPTVQGNWQKQLADAVSDPEQLLRMLQLDPKGFAEDLKARQLFPMRVPQSFIARMQVGDAQDPLLQQVLPLKQEFFEVPGFSKDPLGEQQSAVPGLLHKYQSRVLMIVRGGCAVNCRYCFRRHFPYQDNSPNKAGWQQAFDYIKTQPEVNEVIFSGGDPLMANDQQLSWLIDGLEALPQLTRLRIHTRLPVVIPDRITDSLVERLANSRLQVLMTLHINHPNELNKELSEAFQRLAQAGVQLLNQNVLLKGINDDASVLAALSEKLFASKVLPYYLFLLDRVEGAAHFEVPEAQAVALVQELHRRLPGYLVPRLSREQAGQNSKTPIDLGMHGG